MAQRTTQKVAPLSTRASVGTVDAKARTVEVVWSTGAKVLRSNWMDGVFYEELDMSPKAIRLERLNNGAPFLANHDSYDVARTLGVVESARIENGRGVATVRFAKAEDDPEADKVFRKVADGIIRSVSVGYRVHRAEKIVTEGEKIPTMRVVDWTPYEISAVALPADAGAGFRSDVPTNDCEITFTRDTQERHTMEPEELKRQEAEALKRSQEVQAAQKAAADAAVLAERERSTSIRSAVRAGKLSDDIAERMINDGTTVEKARAFVLDEIAKRSDAETESPHESVTGVAGGDDRDKFVRGVSAWAFEKAGLKDVETAAKRGVKGFEKIELDGGQFRGMTLEHIARECLRRQGVNVKGIYDRKRIFDLALERRSNGSTGDFAVLFENVLYKSMRAAYAVQSDTWRRFCSTDTVQDFKNSNRLLNSSFGTLPVVPENGEYRNLAIPDGSKLSINTETRGAIIGLSRQAMINDDMGALLDVAVRFGRTAGRTIEKQVYDLLALNSGLGPTLSDASPFFDNALRSNVSTGAAISVAALDADRIKMRQQMDASANDFLDLMPTILLVSPALESTAKVLNESAYDHTSTSDSSKPNVVRGMFADIVSSPRLSGTRRYLFTAIKEAIKVVFLEGSGEGPVMESQDGFRVDGTEWKVRIDAKVNSFDPKHALTNAGV